MPKNKKGSQSLLNDLITHKSVREDLHSVAYMGFNDDGNVGCLIKGQFNNLEKTLILHQMLDAFLGVKMPNWIIEAGDTNAKSYLLMLGSLIEHIADKLKPETVLEFLKAVQKSEQEDDAKKKDESQYH